VKKIVVSVVQCIDVAMFSGGHHNVRVVKIETTEVRLSMPFVYQ
jgi:hypothetical protein